MPGTREVLEFYGGDLEGVRQKLNYLQALGITALYLNPIFTSPSPSSHKYDTVDYTQVDSHFGGNEALANLCVELKTRGMRLMLDAVVNHTSEHHAWFDRYGEYAEPGAYQSAASKTRRFYTFRDAADPDSYVGWCGVRTLPVLDFSQLEVQEAIYAADDAVLRRWLRPPYAIDGWRFDVIHMLGEGPGAKNNATYVRHFRRTLRQENPEAYFLGEHFFEATPWLQGDQEDAAMNYYGFAMPLRAFLAGVDHHDLPIRIDAADLKYLLARARCRLPFEIQLSQFNLLDSHDTARLLTCLNGNRALMKIALYTYIGVPCVYYGDEVGLEGAGGPDRRRCFPWDERVWDRELLEYYRRLIQVRKEHRALREGAYLDLHAQGDVIAFARLFEREVLITVLNRGEATAVSLPLWQAGLADEMLTSLLTGEKVCSARRAETRAPSQVQRGAFRHDE